MTAAEAPPVGFTLEGGGVVAGCKRCGWEIWKSVRSEAETASEAHKCLASDVKLWKRLRKGIHAPHKIPRA